MFEKLAVTYKKNSTNDRKEYFKFNDEATVYGASFFARVVESQLPIER